jgi:ABC-type transport system substrate-binding protein
MHASIDFPARGRSVLRARRWAIAAAALLPLALFACTDRGVPSADAKDAGAPTPGGTFVIGAPTDLGALNPLVATEAYTQEMALHALFVPLVTLDSVLAYAPALARSWDISGDTAIVFHLRDDVRWHDGVPVRAGDVAFTFERLKDPETGFGNVEYLSQSERRVPLLACPAAFVPVARFALSGKPPVTPCLQSAVSRCPRPVCALLELR